MTDLKRGDTVQLKHIGQTYVGEISDTFKVAAGEGYKYGNMIEGYASEGDLVYVVQCTSPQRRTFERIRKELQLVSLEV